MDLLFNLYKLGLDNINNKSIYPINAIREYNERNKI